MAAVEPFRVLSLDGGGMRGTYTATYLDCLATTFARRLNKKPLDIGTAFDLIVGTSTGGIIGCAIAAGIPLPDVVDLYRSSGSSIFRRPLPSLFTLVVDLVLRRRALRKGEAALRAALEKRFESMTLGELYRRRGIALAITAVELSQHRSWVFKTPHNKTSTNYRDDDYSLVDICLATSAAPIYRSLASVRSPVQRAANDHLVFADGGLWANNPVLVALIEAMQMADDGRPIEIYSIGTCPMPAGELITPADVHRGLGGWKFGGNAASLSIDAQQFAYDQMAKMLAPRIGRPCQVIRFPSEQSPASLMPYLGLDNTSEKAISALINQARSDASLTNSQCADSSCRDGQCINRLFEAMQEFEEIGRPDRN